MTKPLTTNRLIHETSPYLQQHAHNPVDWYAWGEEALAKARLENKPILLSIGYAACHWCHVMAHESFADPETAAIMNQLFINIKVDREERPDLDKIYQTAHYLLTQQAGGWPLTVFLTPDDLTPFFTGTYFPAEERYQLPSFKMVLKGIAHFYQQKPDEIKNQNNELLKILKHTSTSHAEITLTDQPIQLAQSVLQRHYDSLHGGFGHAPKFPQPTKLEFLSHYSSTMVVETLRHMANAGIYDQLAGGFYRYAVDANWQIPHFEKMLYDNGQLLFLYTQAAKQYQQPFFAEIARATAIWILKNMQSSEGGYFSSIDADSEGEEGKFYIWDKTEISSLLTPDEYEVIELYFGLDEPANFEQYWHLHVRNDSEKIAKILNKNLSTIHHLVATAKEKLLSARTKRIAPARDEKILTAWNALVIKAMFIAGQQLHEPLFIQSGERALNFIHQHLWKNQRLLASYKDGRAHLPAYLDDYAFLLDALITALQVTWKTEYLHFAMQLAEILLTHFTDKTAGGFYFIADDHEKLLYRPKTMMDEAQPAGNAIAARALIILGYLLGETRYLGTAQKTLEAAWAALLSHPAEHCALLLALKQFLEPPTIVIIRGNENEIKTWQEQVTNINHYVFAIPDNITDLPATLATKESREKTCAYVCRGTTCLPVIEDFSALSKLAQ